MRLKLFDLIDETIDYLELNQPSFQYVQAVLIERLSALVKENDYYLGYYSRIKSSDSLKEKIIRNKYYLKYKSGEEIIEQLPDLIGIILECRFLRDEEVLFQHLQNSFNPSDDDYWPSLNDPNLFLNFAMIQPQSQNNGLPLYRLDGYYIFNEQKVRFELQIKSLIHSFWSDIEHEIVYKNNNYVLFDSFMKQNINAIRSNLNVIDYQLRIMYDQVKLEEDQQEIGFTESSFKMFMAKAINDLYSLKVKESITVSTNFKKESAVLSHYIYINDFLRTANPQERMIQYFEHLNLLEDIVIDFTTALEINIDFSDCSPFVAILGEFLCKQMNVDFNWRTFFGMLFAIQEGDSIKEFKSFLLVYQELLVSPSWFADVCKELSDDYFLTLKEDMQRNFATILTKVAVIEMIHEDNIYEMMNIYRNFFESNYEIIVDEEKYRQESQSLYKELEKRILLVF